jgi:predicted nucleotide-binding protein
MTQKKNAATETTAPQKRSYLKQSDVPMTTLDDALRVPQAILNHYAGKSSTPLHVAKALTIDPGGSQFKLITGAAIAFALIDGGAQATAIGITDLARRILRPKAEQDDLLAKREAALLPRVFGQFLRQYDGHPLPRADIAQNVLEEMGVPRDKTAEVLDRIDSCARSVGFIEEIKDKLYVTLQGAATPLPVAPVDSEIEQPESKTTPSPELSSRAESSVVPKSVPVTASATPKGSDLVAAIADDLRRRRVFITHGKNKELVDPIRKLLEYGELEPVVSVDRQSVSKPVPEKVMDDMRNCGAAIIHVDAEQTIVAKDGAEHVLLNPNVLIEIGAAMAFYGRRFILLVREGVKLPSNLQGLYEVRYSGDTLDAVATIRLLESIKDIKNYALPSVTEDAEV